MFSIDKKTGLLNCAIQIESPNYDLRTDETDISLIVIHGISLPPAEFGGGYVEQFFTNTLDCTQHPYFEEIKEIKVSSHLLIDREGTVKQFVPFNKRAWHAGVSQYKERDCCNDFSIGIELEGADDIEYSDIQYTVLQQVCQCLTATYTGILKDNIVGHCDIAPGRKTDPGESFDWQRFQAKEP